jgi:uncharacterized protein YdaU (DUF1376 family)
MAKSDDKADVWMPLYIGDYLADTTRLTTEQHGAYLLMIMDYWRNGPPPDEKIVLQNITRLSDFLWKKHWPVLQKFFRLENGQWHHKRIDAEKAEAVSGKAGASEKARKAAEARWGKKDAPSIPQADAPGMLEESPSHSQSQSPVNPLGSAHTQGDAPRVRATPAELTIAMRRHTVDVQPGDPRVIAAADAGVTVQTVEAACAHAKSKKQGQRVNAGFVLSIAESWTREAQAERQAAGARIPQQRNYHDERADVIAQLTGRKAAHQPAPQTANEGVIDVDARDVPRRLGA